MSRTFWWNRECHLYFFLVGKKALTNEEKKVIAVFSGHILQATLLCFNVWQNI
jgi:hypothetical protein